MKLKKLEINKLRNCCALLTDNTEWCIRPVLHDCTTKMQKRGQ